MLKIDPTIRLQEEVICSELKKLKTTVERFRLPYTQEQVYTMLRGACRAEVEHRGREFKCTEQFDDHLRSVTQWLTTSGTTFGLFLCGSIGNGKTTFLRALQSLVNLLRSDEPYGKQERENRGFVILNAKDMVLYAKAYNNPTMGNREHYDNYRRAMNIDILGIDELGIEPKESRNYGDFVTAATDLLRHRYDKQLCTMITSNLAPSDVADYYDARLADRFREMMHIVNFSNDPSFRTVGAASRPEELK